jgi:hypothetical protein
LISVDEPGSPAKGGEACFGVAMERQLARTPVLPDGTPVGPLPALLASREAYGSARRANWNASVELDAIFRRTFCVTFRASGSNATSAQ